MVHWLGVFHQHATTRLWMEKGNDPRQAWTRLLVNHAYALIFRALQLSAHDVGLKTQVVQTSPFFLEKLGELPRVPQIDFGNLRDGVGIVAMMAEGVMPAGHADFREDAVARSEE